MPGNILTDTSLWSVISTRFGEFLRRRVPRLWRMRGCRSRRPAGCRGIRNRHPTHFTLELPTLVVDVVDKSGYVGLTGTALDGAIRFVTQVADDLINEVATVASRSRTPPNMDCPVT